MTKGMKRCFVPCCGNKENSGKILVAVPYSRDNADTLNTRRKWFEAIGLQMTMSNKLYCCEDHFVLETDATNWEYFKTMGDSVKIKKEVVPHKFLTGKNPSKASQLSPTAARRKLEIKTRIQSGDVRLQPSFPDVKMNDTPRDVTIPICSLEVQDGGCDGIFSPEEILIVKEETIGEDDCTCTASGSQIDSDMRRFVCDLCGYKAFERNILIKHMRSHIGDESFATCDCEAGRRMALKAKRLRSLGIKTFVCQVCSYTTSSSYHMNRHMTTHVVEEEEENDEPYV